MSAAQREESFPRGALLGAGTLLALTFALVISTRVARLSAPAPALPATVESISLRFEDRPDGAIAVFDAATGREVSEVPPRSNGFIRGVLRGFFRGRKLESLGREAAFRLSRLADGSLVLEDPQTGRRVDLGAFGPTNSAAFATLLGAGRPVAR